MNRKSNLLLLVMLFAIQGALFAQDWENRASLPAGELGRHHPVTFAIDGFGYMVTGETDQGLSNDFYRYDPTDDSWDVLEAFPGPARGFSYGVNYNGKGYMGFGFGENSPLKDLWEFDPVTNMWTELASCPCDSRWHPAFLAHNGKLFVGLGGSQSGNRDDWWEYDIANDSWSQKPNYPAARRHHPYHFTIGDFVYVAFGHGDNAIYNDLYRYDPVTEIWTEMANLPAEGRVAGTQFDYNGKGYALSGQGDDHYYLDTGEFWEYDPATDSWTSLTDHPGPGRWAPGNFIIDGYIYLVAGEDRDLTLKKDLMRFDLNPASGNSNIDRFEEISIFPNPTRGEVLLDMTEAVEQIQILNQSGELIKLVKPENHQADLSLLPAGNYTLQIVGEENNYISRVVKL